MRGGPARLLVPAIVGVVVVLLDQLSKAWIARALGPASDDHDRSLIGSAIRLVYVENRGAAFGLWQGRGGALTVLAVVVLAGVVWYGLRAGGRSGWLAVGVGLIAGGAIGNLLDRVRLGYVVDFVAVGWWPRFNVADSAISLGVVCVLVHALREDARERTGAERDEGRVRSRADGSVVEG